jgi:hypothetical protein
MYGCAARAGVNTLQSRTESSLEMHIDVSTHKELELYCYAFHFVVALTFRHASEELAVELAFFRCEKLELVYISIRSAYASLSWILFPTTTAVYLSPCCGLRCVLWGPVRQLYVCSCIKIWNRPQTNQSLQFISLLSLHV